MTRNAGLVAGVCLLVLTARLSGEGTAAQTAEASHTETVSFAPGGTIRFDHSFGDLYIEGWNRPEVAMTFTRVLQKAELNLIKSPEDSYKVPEDTATLLDAIHLSTEHRSPNELVISTTGQSHNLIRHPFGGRGPVTVRYELSVPRDSHIVIRHGGGNVLVGNVTGGIEATDRNGDIELMLPGPGPYSIDAKTRMGSVSCDFAGKAHVRHFVGDQFAGANGDSPRRIFLRVGFGGITIKDVPPEAYP